MTARIPTIPSIAAAALALCIWLAPASMLGQTNPVKLIKGKITDTRTGQPIDGGRLNVYQGSSTETVTSSKINPGTGAYQLILSPSTEYRFEVVSPRYYTTSFTVNSPAGAKYEETVHDFKVAPIPLGTTVFAGQVFDAGSSTVKETPALRDLVAMMKKERAVVVTITVHPDMKAAAAKKPAPKKGKKGKKGEAEVVPVSAPATDPAKTLAEARAAALKSFFKAQGISSTRFVWDVKSTLVTAAKGKPVENLVVKLSSIQDEEGNDE